jgi:hypothetical protein
MAKRRVKSQIANLTPDQKKSGINLIYLATESVRHTLESSRRKLQLCFKPHLNPKFARKVMGLQSRGNPNWRDFGTFEWESRKKKTIWM